MKKSMQSNRRNFFQMLGIGAFGALMLDILPAKFVTKFADKEKNGKVKAVIHSSAVKRNNSRSTV